MNKTPRKWILGETMVLHGTDRDIPVQRALIVQHQRDYQVQHWIGFTSLVKAESRPTLTGAIRLAESWVK